MAVDQAVEDFIDHADVIVACKLMFEIGQIGGDGDEPAGEQFTEMHADDGILLEERAGFRDDIKTRSTRGPDGGGMGKVKQGRDIAEKITGLSTCRDHLLTFDDFHLALDQDEEAPGPGSLLNHDLTRVDIPNGEVLKCFQGKCHFDYGSVEAVY